MACSRVVPRSTPPSTIKFVPGNTLVISGQGEPITIRGGEATMLRHPGADAPGRTAASPVSHRARADRCRSPAGLPPDQAWPAPWMIHCSRTVSRSRRRIACGCRHGRREPGPPRPVCSAAQPAPIARRPRRRCADCTVVSRSPWNTMAGTIRPALGSARVPADARIPPAALLHRRECRGQIAGRPAGEPRMHADRGVQVGIGVAP